ncbi:hypothetical protein GCM10027053_11370 [Intrasporangium mesophilum]
MTIVNSAQCGRDTAAVSGLLDPTKIAPTGAEVGRSASTVTFDAEGCADPALSAPTLDSSCDPADFPWLPESSVRANLLYALGVRTLTTANFLVDARPSLRQTLMDVTDPGAVHVFREHLEQCGAKTLTSVNGRAVELQLDGQVPLTAKLDGHRIEALQGLDGKDKSALLR